VDRKALVREYKETPRPAGVYRVTHAPSGRTLLGSSSDAPSMLNRIRAQLRMKGHPNPTLQADWGSDGPEAFSFEVLELLDPPDRPDYDASDDLDILEELWVEKLDLAAETRY